MTKVSNASPIRGSSAVFFADPQQSHEPDAVNDNSEIAPAPPSSNEPPAICETREALQTRQKLRSFGFVPSNRTALTLPRAKGPAVAVADKARDPSAPGNVAILEAVQEGDRLYLRNTTTGETVSGSTTGAEVPNPNDLRFVIDSPLLQNKYFIQLGTEFRPVTRDGKPAEGRSYRRDQYTRPAWREVLDSGGAALANVAHGYWVDPVRTFGRGLIDMVKQSPAVTAVTIALHPHNVRWDTQELLHPFRKAPPLPVLARWAGPKIVEAALTAVGVGLGAGVGGPGTAVARSEVTAGIDGASTAAWGDTLVLQPAAPAMPAAVAATGVGTLSTVAMSSASEIGAPTATQPAAKPVDPKNVSQVSIAEQKRLLCDRARAEQIVNDYMTVADRVNSRLGPRQLLTIEEMNAIREKAIHSADYFVEVNEGVVSLDTVHSAIRESFDAHEVLLEHPVLAEFNVRPPNTGFMTFGSAEEVVAYMQKGGRVSSAEFGGKLGGWIGCDRGGVTRLTIAGTRYDVVAVDGGFALRPPSASR